MVTPDNNTDSIKSSARREGSYAESTENARRAPPLTRKTFKEVLQDDSSKKKKAQGSSDQKKEEEELEDVDENVPSLLNLFALEKKGKRSHPLKEEKGDDSLNQPEEFSENKDLLYALGKVAPDDSKKMIHANQKTLQSDVEKSRPFGIETMSTGETPPRLSKEGKSKPSERLTTRFDQEQPELAAVNPMINATVGITVSSEETPQVPIATHIQEIVDKIVKELYVLEQRGQKETVIILQHPPMLKEAHVVVTSFDSAARELNVSFENLTAQAQRVLDQNLAALKFGLESKGYVTHILQTTTQIEHPIPSEASEHREHEREDKGGRQQPQYEEEE